jgi:sec-independent protein translocase protein TatB
MFEMGFGEIVLLFVIGLLVLGPQRLPKVAAELGKWVGRARRTATQLRRQLEHEIELSEVIQPPKPPPPKPPPPTEPPPPAEAEAPTSPSGEAQAAPSEPAAESHPPASPSGVAAQEPAKHDAAERSPQS